MLRTGGLGLDQTFLNFYFYVLVCRKIIVYGDLFLFVVGETLSRDQVLVLSVLVKKWILEKDSFIISV